MRTVKNMLLQPSFNTDALVGKSLSFYASDLDDYEFKNSNPILFTHGIVEPSEDPNSYSINKNLSYFMLELMTGTLSFDWLDFNYGPNLRDMDDTEAYSNALDIYKMYTSKLINIAIDDLPVAYVASVTYDENTNRIVKIKLQEDSFTLDAIERISATFSEQGDLHTASGGFTEFTKIV